MRASAAVFLGCVASSCGVASTSDVVAQAAATDTGALTDGELDALVADAIAVSEGRRLEALLQATDPNERFEGLLGPDDVGILVGAGAYDELFFFGDESFEAERDRVQGVGHGPPPGPGLPARPRRLHDGERGGLDATSCRGCHFAGGPDGAGTKTQAALFRGDGAHLSMTTVRDAPHVQGLGYVELFAWFLNVNLQGLKSTGELQAAAAGAPFTLPVQAGGIDFGSATFFPDGSVDTAGLRGLGPDFVVRPFGHKGRHASLSALVDEALFVHLGLLSSTHEARHADAPAKWLGDGPVGDPDDDGVTAELSAAPAVVLASYLAMLPIPEIHAPTTTELTLAWARGAALFDEVGCAECHRPDLRLQYESFTIFGGPGSSLAVFMAPFAVGLDPKPENLDFGDPESGVPLFAFTDFRRHDMGPLLADAVDEELPDGSGAVPASVWLTRSLWGLADTAPYLHDGRAPTVDDAILFHGGEGTAARIAYAQLDDDDRAAVRVFLMSLTRAPSLLVEP